MKKKIILGIVLGLLATLVFSSIATSGTQMNIINDSDLIGQSHFASSLVGFWNFNEGSGNCALDSSIYANHGTIYPLIGEPTWTTGVSGSALEFDGDDENFVICCDSDTLDNPRTIAAWIKPNDVGSYGSGIAGKAVLTIDKEIHGYSLYLNSDNSVVFLSNDPGYYGGQVPLNEWVHIAVTLDAHELKIYINGTLDSTFTEVDDPIAHDEPLMIGWGFDGSFDEVRIENRPLSETEIFELYENQPPTTPKIDGARFGDIDIWQIYKLTSTDPDGSDVSYYIEWGDGNYDYTDYYPSGMEIGVDHTWENEGKYIIKVKAIENPYEGGFESDWGTLSVTMPRNRAINTPFLNFLEDHPILFQLLQRFLKL